MAHFLAIADLIGGEEGDLNGMTIIAVEKTEQDAREYLPDGCVPWPEPCTAWCGYCSNCEIRSVMEFNSMYMYRLEVWDGDRREVIFSGFVPEENGLKRTV
jgi:hypothetical protein